MTYYFLAVKTAFLEMPRRFFQRGWGRAERLGAPFGRGGGPTPSLEGGFFPCVVELSHLPGI